MINSKQKLQFGQKKTRYIEILLAPTCALHTEQNRAAAKRGIVPAVGQFTSNVTKVYVPTERSRCISMWWDVCRDKKIARDSHTKVLGHPTNPAVAFISLKAILKQKSMSSVHTHLPCDWQARKA